MNEDGIMLSMNEDGTWGLYEEPFATIEFNTEKDYESFNEIFARNKPFKVCEGTEGEFDWYCKCGTYLSQTKCEDIKYCISCGQKLDWE